MGKARSFTKAPNPRKGGRVRPEQPERARTPDRVFPRGP
jgi:hypothetical protein